MREIGCCIASLVFMKFPCGSFAGVKLEFPLLDDHLVHNLYKVKQASTYGQNCTGCYMYVMPRNKVQINWYWCTACNLGCSCQYIVPLPPGVGLCLSAGAWTSPSGSHPGTGRTLVAYNMVVYCISSELMLYSQMLVPSARVQSKKVWRSP